MRFALRIIAAVETFPVAMVMKIAPVPVITVLGTASVARVNGSLRRRSQSFQNSNLKMTYLWNR